MAQARHSRDSQDRRRLKALARCSDAAGLWQLATHLAALAVTATVLTVAPAGPLLLTVLVVHGAVLVFLFAPLHETIHRTAFRSRILNDTVAWVCGALLVLPPGYFRSFHLAHHRHTQDPLHDPELATPKPTRLRAYLWQVSGLPYWLERLATTARHALGRVEEPFVPPQQRPMIGREARLMLGLYGAIAAGSLATGSTAALTYWVVPALLGQPLLRLYLMAEHSGCPLVPDMPDNSRTTRSTGAMRWLAWNMPYHAEHHVNPALPFHALPAAHHLLRDRIAHQAPGYISVHHDLLRDLRRPPVLAPR